MATTITAGRLYTFDQLIDNPRIEIDGAGHILSIGPGEPAGDSTVLTSTFLDIHIHGAVSHDVMYASQSGFDAIHRFLASKGVGHYLPTTVTAPIDATLASLDRIADQVEAAASQPGTDGAVPVGIHLEGPFISHVKRGVHPPEDIVPPDIALFDRFQQAARGNIRLMTIAPEVHGALELIEHAVSQGVRVSLGHSNALANETLPAIAKGASSATHTFNAMRSLDHREPGIAGVVLANNAIYAELICDGIHVAPEVVNLFCRSKGLDKVILVTDGMSATGMPDGTYQLGNFNVEVHDGRATARGVLAGSVLTLDQAVSNFARFTATPFVDVTRTVSHNPAKMLGLEGLFTIASGQPANFNRFTSDGILVETLLHGLPV